MKWCSEHCQWRNTLQPANQVSALSDLISSCQKRLQPTNQMSTECDRNVPTCSLHLRIVHNVDIITLECCQLFFIHWINQANVHKLNYNTLYTLYVHKIKGYFFRWWGLAIIVVHEYMIIEHPSSYFPFIDTPCGFKHITGMFSVEVWMFLSSGFSKKCYNWWNTIGVPRGCLSIL